MKACTRLWAVLIILAFGVLVAIGLVFHTTHPAEASRQRVLSWNSVSDTITNTQVYLPLIARRYCVPWYVDDFNDPTSGWFVSDDWANGVFFTYVNGEYSIRLNNYSIWAGSRAPGFKVSDSIVAVDVRAPSGAYYGTHGLIFGLSDDWTQFYSFEIDAMLRPPFQMRNPQVNRTEFDASELASGGLWALFRYSSGTWTNLASGSSSNIITGTATNRLEIEHGGSLIKAYVNGQFVSSISDSSYTGLRRVGLIVSSSNLYPLVEALFDNFTVCDLTTGAHTIALDPTVGTKRPLRTADQWSNDAMAVQRESH